MIYEVPKIKQKINDAELSKNNIYSCPQTMFKFHPEFDHILAEILKKDKKGILYLIKDNNKIYFNKLVERFKKVKYFDLDRVILLDPLIRDNYINPLLICWLQWTGWNTSTPELLTFNAHNANGQTALLFEAAKLDYCEVAFKSTATRLAEEV